MAVIALVRLDGDTAELTHGLRTHLEPVMGSIARANGALWHALASTPEGVLVIDVWDDADSMRRTLDSPEVRDALARAGLPEPRIDVHELVTHTTTA